MIGDGGSILDALTRRGLGAGNRVGKPTRRMTFCRFQVLADLLFVLTLLLRCRSRQQDRRGLFRSEVGEHGVQFQQAGIVDAGGHAQRNRVRYRLVCRGG